MSVSQHEIDTLVKYCETNLGDNTLWKSPAGYPESLALCLIDAIYSTGSHYTSVVNVITRYQEAVGRTDGATQLLQSIATAGGPHNWAATVANNHKPAHTRPGAPLKSEVIEQAAQLMVGLHIDTVEDLITHVTPNLHDNPVSQGWKRLPSQSSGITYNYLLILAGLPSVKPDRMVLRFLTSALGSDTELSTSHAVKLITATADALGVSARTLDHIVWRAASGRELTD